jgi:hypothetical protein
MPTSKRPQINDVQYPRIPSKILKGVLHEDVVNDESWPSDVLNVWNVETPRYLAWLQRVWQSYSRRVDLRKVSNQEVPKHPEILGRAIRRAPHMEAFLHDLKLLGVQSRLPGLTRAHRPQKVMHLGCPTRLAEP